MGDLDLQHQQGDNDRKNGIAEKCYSLERKRRILVFHQYLLLQGIWSTNREMVSE
jgi:hypothetical protein